jgi:RNA-directed DNA polymerase
MEKPALNDTLMDLVMSKGNVHNAWKQVKANAGGPGIDGVTVEQFLKRIGPRWDKIKHAVLKGCYVPAPVRRVEIPKRSGGTRKLGAPTVLDRVIQQALAQVLTQIFDSGFF